MAQRVLLKSGDIAEIIDRLSEQIYRDLGDVDRFAVVGLQTGGVELARRIRERIEALSGKKIGSGTLDITFYRDDLATRGVLPSIKETSIAFDISTMTILLIDDVIFTGRTTKAALETLTSFGRPKAIRLFALVDRGNRELPIQPDYCGFKIETGLQDTIDVVLSADNMSGDCVILNEAE
ncbi:MAG: bifunctional pyr operon transcriptional regulator/uracil phosphoribosyltransferase PyrR [Spirochaetes bacterium]|nr:bifunctional pyr operon transcriptional regulator/uracil phosphoribosyltransferase PyrR [Spirochaetota bacterium]